jgi:hypothetical protein
MLRVHRTRLRCRAGQAFAHHVSNGTDTMNIALVSDEPPPRIIDFVTHLEIVRTLEDDIVILKGIIAEMAIERIGTGRVER